MRLYETQSAERALSVAAPEAPEGSCLPILLRVPQLTAADQSGPASGNRRMLAIVRGSVLGMLIAATIGLWLLRWHAWLWPEKNASRPALQSEGAPTRPSLGFDASGIATTGQPRPSVSERPAQARFTTSIVPVDAGGSP
jgi:hypothetical protein